MMKRSVVTMVLAGAVAVLLAGCRRHHGEIVAEAPGEAVQLLLEASLAEISDLQATQGDAAAAARMRKMLSEPGYNDIRGPLAQRLLDTLLASGDAEGVLEAYLLFCAADAPMAEAGFPTAIQAAMQGEDQQVNGKRVDLLIATASLPLSLRSAAWQLRIEVYVQAGSVAGVAARVGEIMEGDVEPVATAVFATAVSQGMQIADYAGVETLLAAVEARAGGNAELAVFVHLARGELLIAQEQPEAAWNHYVALSDVIGDSELSRRLPAVLKAAERLGLPELSARVVENAYQRGEAFPLTRDAAAASAVREAADSGRIDVLLAATQTALERGAKVSRFYHGFSRGFYVMIQKATAAEQGEAGALLLRLSQAPGVEEAILGMIASARLDVAFFAQDFKAALAIVEAGVPGYDEKWHEELRDKVSAHIAQQEGRHEDAVALYRKHMERVSAWEQPVINPENGQQMVKEVVLGFNEKRIGDIWSAVPGREGDAAAAYARAREWYGKALEILEKDSPEHAEAVAELAAVPAAG